MRSIRSLLATLLAALLLGGPAVAQTAPAGNAHPQPQDVEDEHAENPFGAPLNPSPFTPETKHAFAQAVDLRPLSDLAVFHNGRVKILDTLARETVETIAGRRDYYDLAPGPDGGGVQKLRYSPLFTFLDLLIDPAYYADKPLIHIEYLPLRRAFLDKAFRDEGEREKWMRLTRLSPNTVFALFGEIAGGVEPTMEMSRGLNHIRAVYNIMEFGHGNLLMVAPDSTSADWVNVSTLPRDSAARSAFRDLAAAWRAGDAARANAAALAIAATLPKINPSQYPTTARRVEAVYNRVDPFEWGYWAYGGAFLALLLAFGTGRRWLVGLGVAALFLAVALHGFGFGARWVIAERLPIQNQFESMTGLALGGVLVGTVIMLLKRQWLFGAAAAGVGFLVLLAATTTGVPGADIGREAAILNTSVLLKYHVTTVLCSYGMITLGFFISVMYLWTYYGSKLRGRESAALAAEGLGLHDAETAGPQRVLADLDRAQMTVLQLAFWGLGVGILLGAWWADHSWGRWWAFDPKETWALITWIVYLIVIHVRVVTSRSRALVTAWLSVAGFFVMLWTYFGVNLVLPGLHAYA